jgi:hypothetical protein
MRMLHERAQAAFICRGPIASVLLTASATTNHELFHQGRWLLEQVESSFQAAKSRQGGLDAAFSDPDYFLSSVGTPFMVL